MNEKSENSSKLDIVKWLAVWALILAAIYGNAYFANEPTPLRIAALLLVSLIILAIAAFTEKGRRVVAFAQDARIELRKVVWPSRQETIKVTLTVVAIVVVTGFFLWLIDTGLLYVVQLITGQRG